MIVRVGMAEERVNLLSELRPVLMTNCQVEMPNLHRCELHFRVS